MNETYNFTEVSTIGDLLVRGAVLHPERTALAFPENRKTYAELMEGAVLSARGLLAQGVKPGEHIGLLSANSVEFVESLFAISMIGCVAVPLNARHKVAELGYIIDNAKLTTLLTTAESDGYVDFSEVLANALPSLVHETDATRLQLPEAPSLRRIIIISGQDGTGFIGRDAFSAAAAGVSPDRVHAIRHGVRIRDTAVIIYTSGTTAHPKGCMLSHEAMTRGPVERANKRFRTCDHEVHWGAGPLFHIGSLAPMLAAIGACSTYLTDTHFEPGRALALMTAEKATMIWPWFPAIVQGLLDHPSFDPTQFESLRKIMLIGPPKLAERVQSLFPGREIMQACGMTETAGIFALSDETETAECRAMTQGKAAPGIEVRILNPETGSDALPGEVGEILVRGYCLMNGYYRDPVKTAEALDPEGWLHTGDLYSMSAEGSLTFNGRLKDMLKVGGENVAAIEVEAFLCEHPAVKIAEVVGRPDTRLDEVPVAFVELRPGASTSEAELIDFCKGRISSYKVPRAIYFLQAEEWPMSATKVNKRVLRARVLEDMERDRKP